MTATTTATVQGTFTGNVSSTGTVCLESYHPRTAAVTFRREYATLALAMGQADLWVRQGLVQLEQGHPNAGNLPSATVQQPAAPAAKPVQQAAKPAAPVQQPGKPCYTARRTAKGSWQLRSYSATGTPTYSTTLPEDAAARQVAIWAADGLEQVTTAPVQQQPVAPAPAKVQQPAKPLPTPVAEAAKASAAADAAKAAKPAASQSPAAAHLAELTQLAAVLTAASEGVKRLCPDMLPGVTAAYKAVRTMADGCRKAMAAEAAATRPGQGGAAPVPNVNATSSLVGTVTTFDKPVAKPAPVAVAKPSCPDLNAKGQPCGAPPTSTGRCVGHTKAAAKKAAAKAAAEAAPVAAAPKAAPAPAVGTVQLTVAAEKAALLARLATLSAETLAQLVAAYAPVA